MKLADWIQDPTDPNGAGVSRPFVCVGAVYGADEDVTSMVLPHPFGGDGRRIA